MIGTIVVEEDPDSADSGRKISYTATTATEINGVGSFADLAEGGLGDLVGALVAAAQDGRDVGRILFELEPPGAQGRELGVDGLGQPLLQCAAAAVADNNIVIIIYHLRGRRRAH